MVNKSNKKRFQEVELSKPYANILTSESSEDIKVALIDLFKENSPNDDYWKQLEELDTDVIDHEPRLALDGGEDGLIFYRRLSERTAEFLKEDGRAFWEIGYDQGQTVAEIVRQSGLKVVEVKKDLAGHDRVVIVEK